MRHISLRNKLIFISIVAVILVTLSGVGRTTVISGIFQRFERLSSLDIPVVNTLNQLKIAASRLISSANELIIDEQLGLGELEDDDDEAEAGAAAGSELRGADDAADDAADGDEAGEADTREELEIVETLVSYNEALAAYRALVQAHASVEDSDLQLLADIESAGQVLLDSADAVVNGLENNDSLAEISAAREALEDGERTFLAVIEVALAEEFADLEESEAIVSQTADILTRLAFASIFLTLLLVIGASLYLFSTVLRPMLNLTQTAQRLGAGDLTARSSDSAGDEIGQFAATFNMMADSIQQQISATEAARARAERSDQVKSSFLASVSHELRTPLNAIINFTRFVVDGDTGPVNEQQRELLTEVVGSGRHLLSLINDVLDMSKIEAGALSLFIEDGVDVNALLKTALTTTQNLLGDKPVALVTQIDPALPLIRADKQRVLQILLNILGNAAKFTAQGSITVTARPQGDSVLIAVQDTGPGIAVADQPKVFEAFQQATEGLRQGGGTGLGMPISKSLAEAHGGQLWLESTPGQGATFSVRLPVASTALVASL